MQRLHNSKPSVSLNKTFSVRDRLQANSPGSPRKANSTPNIRVERRAKKPHKPRVGPHPYPARGESWCGAGGADSHLLGVVQSWRDRLLWL